MNNHTALNRRFSPAALLMLSINGMIGSAWLFAPLYAAKIAGTGAIFAWLLGGLATALIALTFAELAVLFPVAGGTAQIPNISHGLFTSYILSWIAWLSALTMAPIEVQAVLQYGSTYFPSLMHSSNGVPLLTHLGLVWACILMLGLSLVNVASFSGLIRFNFVLFLFKIAMIIITVIFLLRASYHPVNFIGITNSVSSPQGWQTILAAIATGGVAFAFTGFKHGVELAGEAKKSAFAIPLAIVGSVICCMGLYMALQFAFIAVIEPSALTKGWEHISFIGDVGPFAGLAAVLGLVWLLKLLYIDAAISPLGAGLIYVTSTSRILYAMSQIGFTPKFFMHLNKQKLPIIAIFFNFVLGMLLFLPLPGWQAMVSFLVSGMVISYAIGPIALLCLRKELPNKKRLFRLPAANVLCVLAFYFCNLISYWTGWDTIYKLAIAIGIGFIFFLLACGGGRLKNKDLGLQSAMWLIPYLGGLVLISYLGAFGGRNIIPFGWDFLVIGLFSFVILRIAVAKRLRINEEALEKVDYPSTSLAQG